MWRLDEFESTQYLGTDLFDLSSTFYKPRVQVSDTVFGQYSVNNALYLDACR